MGNSSSIPGPYQQVINPPPTDPTTIKQLREHPHQGVLELLLESLHSINSSSALVTSTDPFVAMRVEPADPLMGDQLQTSSIKPATQSPVWEPPERFRFFLSDITAGKLFFALQHYEVRHPSKPEDLGFTVVRLHELVPNLQLGGAFISHSFDVISPATGVHHGKANFLVRLISVEEALSTQYDVAYEYERWVPIRGWGNTQPGHLLPTDPGRYSSGDGKIFGATLDDVVPPVEDGWEMTQAWEVYAAAHDKDGWQYTMDFNMPFWHIESKARCFVRRRPLLRELRRTGTFVKQHVDGGGERDFVFSFAPKA